MSDPHVMINDHHLLSRDGESLVHDPDCPLCRSREPKKPMLPDAAYFIFWGAVLLLAVAFAFGFASDLARIIELLEGLQ